MRGESPWISLPLGEKETKSGAKVSEESSLSVTSVWACVKLISWTLASLPLIVYRRTDNGGKIRARENPVYKLLLNPNPEITRFQWLSMMTIHQNLWGVGFSEIEFDRTGNPVALWPIPPNRVTPKRTEKGDLVYEVKLDTGEINLLPPYKCLVAPFMQLTADKWLSPIGIHRETVGFAQALTDFGAKTFGQGTNPAGIITHPSHLRETSEENLKKKFAPYQGLGNSHRLMLLEEGMKFERVGLPPEDAQYLETRKFSVSDIARIYSVPLHLLQEHEKSTSWGSGLEEQNLAFITFTMRPYFVQFEQEISRKLLEGSEEFFSEFLVEGLLRGRIKDRYQAYAIGRQWGWMSANDIRRIENMNPIEDGDVYLSPMNMTPADRLGQTTPAPGAGEEGD